MADEEEEEILEGSQETEKQKKDKVSKKHEEIMKVIIAVLGSPERLKRKKTIKSDVTARVVAKLFKKEQEDLELQALDGLSDLLKKYAEYQEERRKKLKDLDDLDLKKKKEFNEVAGKWLQMVDRQAVMATEYADLLRQAFTAEDEKKKD